MSNLNFDNYFELFGVELNFTDKDLKKKYKHLVLKYHPDRNPDKDTTDIFQKIHKAYELLQSPTEREIYTRTFRAAQQRKIKEQEIDKERKRKIDKLVNQEENAKKQKVEERQKAYMRKYTSQHSQNIPTTTEDIKQQITSISNRLKISLKKKGIKFSDDLILLQWDNGLSSYSADDITNQFKSYGTIAHIEIINDKIGILFYKNEEAPVKVMYAYQVEKKQFGQSMNPILLSWVNNSSNTQYYQPSREESTSKRSSEIPPSAKSSFVDAPSVDEFLKFESKVLEMLLQRGNAQANS